MKWTQELFALCISTAFSLLLVACTAATLPNVAQTIPQATSTQPLATDTSVPAATSTALPTATPPPSTLITPTNLAVAETSPLATPESVILPTPTPILLAARSPAAGPGLMPAPAPVGTVVYYEESIDLPTYPYEQYEQDAVDPAYHWPYRTFDRERFLAENPAPTVRTYRLIVLENAYLKVSIAPELGGRILQIVHKPSGDRMLYRNKVIKPSPWGPGHQLGWRAAGGIEWNLPVIEHGYDWGAKWGIIPLQHSDDLATVTIFTPNDGRWLQASINILLRAGSAALEIEPTLRNLHNAALTFDYWHSAALSPGPGNQLSEHLRFIIPHDQTIGAQMSVHSTFDASLPGPSQLVTWPVYQGRDLSRLGTWQQYAGFFEAPTAHGPFIALYDSSFDAGAVRVYPSAIAKGSKIFSLGWGDPLPSSEYTDDGSQYVEIHGGLGSSFDQHVTLPANGEVTWRELWYPVHGISDLSTANEVGALYTARAEDALRLGFYPTRPFDGMAVIASQGQTIVRQPIQARPDAPTLEEIGKGLLPTTPLVVQIEDDAGNMLLEYKVE